MPYSNPASNTLKPQDRNSPQQQHSEESQGAYRAGALEGALR